MSLSSNTVICLNVCGRCLSHLCSICAHDRFKGGVFLWLSHDRRISYSLNGSRMLSTEGDLCSEFASFVVFFSKYSISSDV